MKNTKTILRILIVCLIALWAGISVVKFGILGYGVSSVIPRPAYTVRITTSGQGHGSDISVRHFLPLKQLGQQIRKERFEGDFANYKASRKGHNRVVAFSLPRQFGEFATRVSFTVLTEDIEYRLPDILPLKQQSDAKSSQYLLATPLVQVNDSVIARKALELGLDEQEDAVDVVRRIFDYVHTGIANATFSGETDAVLTCRLGKASCNGKSRLMVALCRHMGIPSRLVGGLILRGRPKRTTHQWVEVYLGSSWVSFCPLNGYFARKPEHYLALYQGDHPFFKHTKNIAFDYSFKSHRKMVARDQELGRHRALDIVNVWKTYNRAGIPIELLMLVLVVPVGALVTIIFRNVIGLPTFGTFLPALIAYSFQGTGILWGVTVFVAIILAGAAIDWVLSRLRLLHTPKLTVIMVFIVLALLTVGTVGIAWGNFQVARSFFFPLAILSITTERFFVVAKERGVGASLLILCSSMVVVAFCYMVMSSMFLRMIMVVLPETYLLLIAASLYVGHWTGLRISEYIRFRSIIRAEGANS